MKKLPNQLGPRKLKDGDDGLEKDNCSHALDWVKRMDGKNGSSVVYAKGADDIVPSCVTWERKQSDPTTYCTQLFSFIATPSMTAKLPSLIPPFRYAIVEDGLFRGGYPKARNMRFLKRWES